MRISVITRGVGCLLGLILLIALPVQASEQDELASAQRMLIQVQAALERARVAAVQADRPEQGRFWFDYSRAQPRDSSFVAGNYRRKRP